MVTITELSDLYGNILLGPRHGRDVCRDCFNLTDGHDRCFACTCSPRCLATMIAISYSVGGEQLHHALASYKRLPTPAAEQLALPLAAILSRFLMFHERCVGAAAAVDRFPIVTSVPSRHEPPAALERMLVTRVAPVRDRYRPLLRRQDEDVAPHRFSVRRYSAIESLKGEPVLLIDDTWTTGANAQSAAATLTQAGAGPVAALVIGRFVNRRWHRNDIRLRSLPQPFDWMQCAWCAEREAQAA